MVTFLVVVTVALIANDAARTWLLGVLFGDAVVEPLALEVPEDAAAEYADNVYQVFHQGYSEIRWLTGVQVRNLLAFGHTVAYVA